MTAMAVLVVLMGLSGALGYLAGRRTLDDERGPHNRWLPPDRRRWRP